MDPSRSHRLVHVINNCEGTILNKYVNIINYIIMLISIYTPLYNKISAFIV